MEQELANDCPLGRWKFMTRIICLANSLKYGDRCIAGIDPTIRQWVRPWSDLADGRITLEMRLIDDQEPALLDILEIPLAETGPLTWNFESENRSLLPGAWQRVSRAQPADVLPYCGEYAHILHNDEKFVTVSFLKSLPVAERRTLQLVYAKAVSVRSKAKPQGGRSWKGTLTTPTGQQITDAIITDPAFIDRLETDDLPQNPCLVTVSLSLPYRPAAGWEGDDPCWKLISGVIELA